MTYHIAVCDDREEDAEYIAGLVTKWAERNRSFVKLECFPSAEAFLFCYAEDKTWDMLLLDVEMGQMNGVELARSLRRENALMQIIFVTGYSDYISEGYDVSALHYLMKPVREEKLFQVLDRGREQLVRQERKLVVSAGGETVRIPLYEIRYVQVQGNYITIYAGAGVEVSGGEAQKIAIARALYKNAPFIILDEPTAALDPVAEYEVYSRLNEIVEDKTAVFISHRLSSCRFCDRIAVFEQGDIVEYGDHEQLLRADTGVYRRLRQAQAQYYKEEGLQISM